MSKTEMSELLERQSFGHLACARDNRPYVVPMNFAHDGKDFYFFTTQGMKTRFIDANPEVCLQVEEVTDSTHWRSVMVTGKAEQITSNEEMQKAMSLITQRNPSLTPAISATSLDSWGRAVDVALYRIKPEIVDGRKTVKTIITEPRAVASGIRAHSESWRNFLCPARYRSRFCNLRRFVDERVLALSCAEQQTAERSESGPKGQADNRVNAAVVARV